MIYNVKDLVVGDKITVGVGIPLQLAWSILGWFAVSISGVTSGREINFFSDSHLAPKFFKVIANSKKVGRHFQRQTKSFFMLSAF